MNELGESRLRWLNRDRHLHRLDLHERKRVTVAQLEDEDDSSVLSSSCVLTSYNAIFACM